MKFRWTSVAVLAVALSLPAAAFAERGGHHGGRGEGKSRSSQGGEHGKRGGWNRGGGGERGKRDGGWNRGGGERRKGGDARWSGGGGHAWRGSQDGGRRSSTTFRGDHRSRGETRFRAETRVRVDGGRGEWRGGDRGRTDWRSAPTRTYARDHGSYSRGGSYSQRVRYKGDYPSHSRYYGGHRSRSHWYYTGNFYRPRFVHHSAFSLGLVIGAVPAIGYQYFDPYCDAYYSSLDDYYGHCGEYSHPEAIVVIDAGGGYPVATCVYGDGGWVVDDCGEY